MSNSAQKASKNLPDTPAEREAKAEPGATTVIEWDGVDLSIPAAPEGLRADVFLAFEEGKAVTALRGVLGAHQYAKHISAQNKTLGELEDLFAEVMKHYGFDQAGE